MVNVVPRPGALSTLRSRLEIGSEPANDGQAEAGAAGLRRVKVVERARELLRPTSRARCRRRSRARRRSGERRVSSVTCPPPADRLSIALRSRLSRIRRSTTGSPNTGGSASAMLALDDGAADARRARGVARDGARVERAALDARREARIVARERVEISDARLERRAPFREHVGELLRARRSCTSREMLHARFESE